jgi:hypothetical protein
MSPQRLHGRAATRLAEGGGERGSRGNTCSLGRAFYAVGLVSPFRALFGELKNEIGKRTGEDRVDGAAEKRRPCYAAPLRRRTQGQILESSFFAAGFWFSPSK